MQDRLQALLTDENRRLAFETSLLAVIGLAICLVVFGLSFVLLLIPYFGIPRVVSALIGTTLLAVGSLVAAWRQVNPLEGMAPLSMDERMEMKVRNAIGAYGGSPRFALAGLKMLFMSGPTSLFAAWRDWRRRFTWAPEVVDAAADLLAACQTPQPLQQVAEEPALLLLELRLAKVVGEDAHARLSITQRGKELIA